MCAVASFKKCLERIIKKCETCRKDVISKNEDERNAYVKAKEYFLDKKLLLFNY